MRILGRSQRLLSFVCDVFTLQGGGPNTACSMVAVGVFFAAAVGLMSWSIVDLGSTTTNAFGQKTSTPAVFSIVRIIMAIVLFASGWYFLSRIRAFNAAAETPQSFRAYIATHGIHVITRDMPHTAATIALVRVWVVFH